MSYKRKTFPMTEPSRDDLTAMMGGIGINVATDRAVDPNIEDTLYWASVDGMIHDDYRTLGLMVLWLDIHLPRVNADRVVRILSHEGVPTRVRAFWKAVGQRFGQDRRLKRWISLYRGRRVMLPSHGADFRIQRHGEDGRFKGTALQMPNKLLRQRDGDVWQPKMVARLHRAYRWRVLTGPTYRADMLAELEGDPELSAYELARRTYGSFATAHEVKKDWELTRGFGLSDGEPVSIR